MFSTKKPSSFRVAEVIITAPVSRTSQIRTDQVQACHRISSLSSVHLTLATSGQTAEPPREGPLEALLPITVSMTS